MRAGPGLHTLRHDVPCVITHILIKLILCRKSSSYVEENETLNEHTAHARAAWACLPHSPHIAPAAAPPSPPPPCPSVSWVGVVGVSPRAPACAWVSLSLSLSLSYIITRVAPHCVNTLRMLHAAYDATKETCPLVNPLSPPRSRYIINRVAPHCVISFSDIITRVAFSLHRWRSQSTIVIGWLSGRRWLTCTAGAHSHRFTRGRRGCSRWRDHVLISAWLCAHM